MDSYIIDEEEFDDEFEITPERYVLRTRKPWSKHVVKMNTIDLAK